MTRYTKILNLLGRGTLTVQVMLEEVGEAGGEAELLDSGRIRVWVREAERERVQATLARWGHVVQARAAWKEAV